MKLVPTIHKRATTILSMDASASENRDLNSLVTIGDVGMGLVLALACLAGVFMTMFRLPGTWLILLTAVGFGWYDGWQRITLTALIVLVVIALVAEVLETTLSVVAVRRVGASRQAAWGGVIGGFLGILVFAVPVPLVGPILGALLGCFTGAMIGEVLARRDLRLGTKAGLVSAIGFAFGAMLKTTAAIAMSGVVAWAAIFPRPGSTPVMEPSSPRIEAPVTPAPEDP